MEFAAVHTTKIGAFPKALAAIVMMRAACEKLGEHDLHNAVVSHMDRGWVERVNGIPARVKSSRGGDESR